MFQETCPIKNELWTVINLIFLTSRSIFDSKQAKTRIIGKIKCRWEANRKTQWWQGALWRDETALNRLIKFRVGA